jgi:hypothetical protein
MKLIRVIRNAFAASLIISARRRRPARRSSRAARRASRRRGVGRGEGADDDAVRVHEVADALPSARNSGFET